MASPWQLAQDDPHYMRLGEYLAAKLTGEEMTRLQEVGEVSREGLEKEFLRDPWEKLDIRKVVDPQYITRPFVLVVSLKAKDHSTCPLYNMVKKKDTVQWENEVATREPDTENRNDESKGNDDTARGRFKTWKEHEKGKRIQGIFKWKQHRKQEELNSHAHQDAIKKPKTSKFIVQAGSNTCKETITNEIRKILLKTYKSKAFINRGQKVFKEKNVPNKLGGGWKNCKQFLSEKSQERNKSKKKKEKDKELVCDTVAENTEIEESKRHNVGVVKVSNLVNKPCKVVNNIKAVIKNELIKSGVEQNPGPNPSEQNVKKKKSSEMSRKLKRLSIKSEEGPMQDKKIKLESYENSSSDGEDDEEKECEEELSKDESSYESDSDTEEEQEEEDDETNKHVDEDDYEKEESEDDGWHQYPSDYEDPFWDTLHNKIANDVEEERKDEADSDSSFECDPSDQCPFTARMEGGGCKKCKRKSEIYSRMARAWTGEKKSCSKDNIEVSKLSVNDRVRKSYGPPMDQDPSCVHRLQVSACFVLDSLIDFFVHSAD